MGMTLEQFANLAGALGTCALAVPSISATRWVLQIKRGTDLAEEMPDDHPKLKQWTKEVNETLAHMKDAWRPRDAVALFGGLFLTFLSYALPLLKGIGWIS